MVNQIIVTLNQYEMTHASLAGCQRRINSMGKRPQFYGAEDRKNFWEIDVIGMIAEMAVAKAFDLYWQPGTDKRLSELRGDVGEFQVRSTTHRTGHLFLHPNDKDANYFLAIVKDNRVLLPGWIGKQEGLEVGQLREHDTYWVSQDELRPMDYWLDFGDIVLSDEVVVRPVN